MNLDKLANHLSRAKYGDFWLCDGIRPSLDVPVIPQQGYRLGNYRDAASGLTMPMLAAAVSRERLFDLLLDLLEPLGEEVDVVLESSHANPNGRHQEWCREHIDLPVLASTLYDFDDLLLNDGYAGIAVMSTTNPMEVQFDEHKLLIVYARNLRPFEGRFLRAGVVRNDQLQLISEADHLHRSQERYRGEFERLGYRLGAGQAAAAVSW